MEPFEALSEAVIDILEGFSLEERPITIAALKEALSARKDIIPLLRPEPVNHGRQELSAPGNGPARVLPAESETPMGSNTEPLSKLRNVFFKILGGLRPVIKEDFENQFSELHKKIMQCESLISLGGIGEQIGALVIHLIDESVKHMNYSNDFLVELSKDLYKMEGQLSVFQDYNRDTHHISSDFHNDLLSHTDDIHRAFDSSNSPKDVRRLITSKLSAISKAIEMQRQTDEGRLQEADAKIAELQNNIQTYTQEIQQVRERADSLEKEIMLDELTQINNRRAFELQIRENLRRYHRNKEKFSLILMDIDHFKKVNDEYGHKAGDKCLQEITKLIRSALRKTDFLARYGGEELIAILHGCNAENAENFAKKIRIRIEQAKFYYQEKIIPVTISLGVTEVLPDDSDAEIPFIRVDEAMYRAKKGGRNRVSVITDLSFCKTSGSNFGTGQLAAATSSDAV